MGQNDLNDDFLAKWADKSLSNEEQISFEKTQEGKLLKTILKGTDLLDVPAYDMDKVFANTRSLITSKRHIRKKKTLLKWSYLVAASIALLIVVNLFLFDTDKSYKTSIGEQLAVVLPDSSEVILNAKSKIDCNFKDWKISRKINLKGQAFFKVNKGSDFIVQTKLGDVSVLGTKFTVNAVDSIFEVICFEGKVKVEHEKFEEFLTKGQALKYVNSKLNQWNVESNEPSWIIVECSFVNAPLRQVILALEKQYDISINAQNIDQDILFTGGFTHSDLSIALKSVFDAFDIKYTFSSTNSKQIILSKGK